MSTSRRATAFSIASRPGRSFRPLAPDMPLSEKTCTTSQPWRLAADSSSRRWFAVVWAARGYSQVKGSALCARYCLRLASRLGHRPPASAGTLASTAVNGEREKPLKTGHFGCRISPGFSEHSAATHLSAIAAARLHVCESQRANVVRVDPRPFIWHARLSPMKLAGDPNSPVRFKDDATADELRAELMKRLRILVSAGLIDLSFAGCRTVE